MAINIPKIPDNVVKLSEKTGVMDFTHRKTIIIDNGSIVINAHDIEAGETIKAENQVTPALRYRIDEVIINEKPLDLNDKENLNAFISLAIAAILAFTTNHAKAGDIKFYTTKSANVHETVIYLNVPYDKNTSSVIYEYRLDGPCVSFDYRHKDDLESLFHSPRRNPINRRFYRSVMETLILALPKR